MHDLIAPARRKDYATRLAVEGILETKAQPVDKAVALYEMGIPLFRVNQLVNNQNIAHKELA